ncbi:MAG: hypothetical protein H0T89_00475 [Deltaproteobacteria bacterium]|nr:hypothetical protein [Deltaproteobacteria bacterium]MDQ3301542.1 hypothetical protein [Myxococcota bacterium]
MKKSLLIITALGALGALGTLGACGDNGGSGLDGGTDVVTDVPATPPRAVVVAGDFVTPGFTGIMSALDVQARQVMQRVSPNGSIGNDPMLRRVGDELFVVNRADGNSVTILDATTFALVEQLATGAGSNPQDVAVAGPKLFIPAMGTSGVVVATRGSTTLATIDLSDLDPDGKPDCVSAYRVGGDVYVACGLLDQNFSPRGPGKVVVIDAATNTRKSTVVTLTNPNPFGVFEALPAGVGGGLVIPTVSFANVATGCVERISTGAVPANAGCITTNAALGGYAGRLETQNLGTTAMLWMIVPNGMFGAGERSRLWGFDLTSMTLWPDALTPEAQLLVDMAVCPDDTMVVADKTEAANGLRVYEGGIEKTTAALSIGLKPGSTRGLVCY